MILRSLPRLRLLITVPLAAFLLAGCVVRVAYEQLDWLALWYIEGFVDLDATQEAQAREMIARTLSWHRSTQLPQYARLVRKIRDELDGTVDARLVAERFDEIVVLQDALLRQVAPDLARLLASLSEEQVGELFAGLEDRNRDLAKEYSDASRARRIAKRDKAVLRAFRRFTGRLGPEQEQLVRARTAEFHDLSEEWLVRRKEWQSAFRSLMAGGRKDPGFADRLAALLLEPNQFDSAAYRTLVRENQQASFELVAAVLASLTPRQGEKLRGNLAVYASDFEALMARTKPSGGF